MKPRGIILYGPPASGKSSITEALTALNPNYKLFKRLKVGGGRSDSYRMTTEGHLVQLREAGKILWENAAYGANYAIERDSIVDALSTQIPIIHVGQPAAVQALVDEFGSQLLKVALRCPRDVAHSRLIRRGDSDVPERLTTWEQTPPLSTAELTLNTDRLSVRQAASHIAILFDG